MLKFVEKQSLMILFAEESLYSRIGRKYGITCLTSYLVCWKDTTRNPNFSIEENYVCM